MNKPESGGQIPFWEAAKGGEDSDPSVSGKGSAPLAEQLRPQTIADVVGQDHLTGPDGPLSRFLLSERLPSIILWGPPGTGKTTLARLLGEHPNYETETFSAVLSGVKDVRSAVERAKYRRDVQGLATLLFVDEIHRFNKSQQDAFLPHVEDGTITLLAATTENPSFHVNAALLSRCRVYVLNSLTAEQLLDLGKSAWRRLFQAEGDDENDRETDCDTRIDSNASRVGLEATVGEGEGRLAPPVADDAWLALTFLAQGDARALMGSLEVLAEFARENVHGLDRATVESVLQRSTPRRLGDGDHFDWASALQKSIRGSDPHAAVFWFTQMVEGGEDPRYIARRLVVMASEDVGLADPGALAQAIAARDAFEGLGAPEGLLALAQCAIYLALCPKSNSVYQALNRARERIANEGSQSVPLWLRNGTTSQMRELGYGEGYRSPHQVKNAWLAADYLPEGWAGQQIYVPGEQGREGRMVSDHGRRTEHQYGLTRSLDSEESDS